MRAGVVRLFYGEAASGRTYVHCTVRAMGWTKRRRADPLRVATAGLLGALQRLEDLSRPEFARRFTDLELERERADAHASIDRLSAEVRQLGGDPGAVG